jgi:phosphatidate cytidylyltransferase
LNEKNRNLFLRIGSAVLLLPGVIFLLVKGALWSGVLIGMAAAICVAEYYLITLKQLSPAAWIGIAAGFAMPVFPAWQPAAAAELAIWTTAAIFLVAWTYQLLTGSLESAVSSAGQLITGFLFGALGLTALSWLRQGPDGLRWVFCTLIATWGNDTSAFFVGRRFGKRKLFPAVSPHKTWEGFAGGMAGSIAGMFVAKATFFGELTVWDCLIVGAAAGVIGPIGDLSESMLKRTYQVKDSSHILPGHGGVLDRIDALIFNAPMVLLYARVLRGFL